MKKLILIILAIIPLNACGQTEDLPWQAGLTRIVRARYTDGQETFDIGSAYVDGTIMIDFSTERIYVLGKTDNHLILKIKSRSTDLEEKKHAKLGTNSNIYLCDRGGIEWIMDLRYDKKDGTVRVNFYYRELDGKQRALLFESRFIPQEKLE